MKKLASILITLAMLAGMSAFAFNGTDYPAWDGSSAPENSLYGSIGGENILLGLDAASEYSGISDGMVQVCFFAYDKAQQNYLELYLLLPETAASGDVFSSAGSGMSSISLYDVSKDDEDLYFASQFSGIPYPSKSNYELRIEAAERDASSLSMRGSIDGVLVRFKDNTPMDETVSLAGVKFDFTLSLSGTKSPQASAAPSATPSPEPFHVPQQSAVPQLPTLPPATKAPQATLEPHPAFTLPPDYVVL